MYKKTKVTPGGIKINECTEGESLIKKIQRIVNNKEPITDGAPLLFTERKDGVLSDTDIRSDKWDMAIETMDEVVGIIRSKREKNIVDKIEKDNPPTITKTE